ncbi:MAG: hypothetical protein M3Y28_08340 [Armatimonadota bacterium]|nr:hypothetical protein [Armatimonadota bacterium]
MAFANRVQRSFAAKQVVISRQPTMGGFGPNDPVEASDNCLDVLTYPRFSRHGNRIELQPQNPNYAPIPLRKADNAAIIGKVVGLLRGYTG